jgi:predicted SAM-dependent methyltransferase
VSGPDAWDWENPAALDRLADEVNLSLARCEKLAALPLAPPYRAADLAELGRTGIEFAAFSSRHPQALASDVLPMTDADGTTTTPGQLYRVDGAGCFLQHDIGDPLPLEPASVDWVYAEHLIEHVPVGVAVAWLTEVRRVLRPGGLLRLTTPDLRRYVESYVHADPFFAKHRNRMRTALSGFAPPMPARPAFMFNQLFYVYGHKWIYDIEELTYVLGRTGYDTGLMRVCSYRTGARPDVADLDQKLRDDETIYVEVTV